MTQLKPEAAGGRAAVGIADIAEAAAVADGAAGALTVRPPGAHRAHGGPGIRARGRWRLSSGHMAAGAVVLAVLAVVATSAAGAGPPPLWWVEAAVAAVIAMYVAAIVFKLVMVVCGITATTRRRATRTMPHGELPAYTVLVPLAGPHQPGNGSAADLIAGLSAIDYPAGRLQVLLLAGENGWRPEGVLPGHFEVVNVGPARRATSAGAYAAGLARARGELCVAYKPGQRPDPGQLRAAASAFGELPPWVVCVRPESRCQNPDTNWLTQCVAAENAVSSVLFLRGLDRFRLPVPASGLSCHFRTDALRRLGAWQHDDRAEGADIGVRIAQRGWSVRMLGSVTREEADGRLGPWLRRRATSIQDDYRTWLAHFRSPYRLWRDLGPFRCAASQLTTALSALTALVNPLFWLLTAAWLAGGPGPIAAVLPLPELEAVIAVMLLGNLLTAYALMIGCMEHGLFAAVRTMLLAPVYLALTSVAAYRALLIPLRPVSSRQVVSGVATS
jgi:glycosyltransferase XagB